MRVRKVLCKIPSMRWASASRARAGDVCAACGGEEVDVVKVKNVEAVVQPCQLLALILR